MSALMNECENGVFMFGIIMKKSVWCLLSSMFFMPLLSAGSQLTIPEGVLSGTGLHPEFVAKFAFFLAILILWTTLLGKFLKVMFNIPVIAGQIIAGIFLGPSLFDVKHLPVFSEPYVVFDRASGVLYSIASSDIFVIFVLLLSAAFTVPYLLWIAGHETDIQDILKVGFTAVTAGVLGALLPISVTAIFLLYFVNGSFDVVQSLGMGLVFAATSVSIPIAYIFSREKMYLRSSKATLGAAIVDDILAVILLSIFFICIQSGVLTASRNVILENHGHGSSIIKALSYMLVSFAVIFASGYYLIPKLIKVLKEKSQTPIIASMANGIMFTYFAFAEIVGGLAGITGAYFAGLFHRMGDKRHSAEKVISPFVNSILLPIFLGSIGLQVNVQLLTFRQWIIAMFLLFLAVGSKFAGCYFATFLSNLRGKRTKQNRWRLVDSYLFGSSMVARGEVGLVIATILSGKLILTQEQYVLCVVVIVLTTIASPFMLSAGFVWLDRVEKAERVKYKDVTVKIGTFDFIGTFQMFNIIVGMLESSDKFKTPTVIFSEGRRVASLEENNVKVIYMPDEGIDFEGNEKEIKKILKMVKKSVVSEADNIVKGKIESQ